MHERVPLITSIFSDRNGVEAVGLLSGNDAQAFVDVIQGVSALTLRIPNDRMAEPQDDLPCLLVRL